MSWTVKQVKNLALKSSTLLVGLPGIANVGKVAVDFLIDELKAQKCYDFSSDSFPHSVFINEKNLIELPKIELYHARAKDKDFLLLGGDVQPPDERACYSFCREILEICQKQHCADIITLGGIGLQEPPEKPKVYISGNTRKSIEAYKEKNIHEELYGVVGPIIGVSGVLLGMAPKETRAVCLLAETYGHPLYLGIKGAKELVKVLSKRFGFKVKLEKLEEEIAEMEKELQRTEQLENVVQKKGEVNYIG
ncbi:MAG: PAC2 family protein [Nanoarchaeota archaeon]|nr:PAC2 family protein [Nanoarchaeota archaeon]